MYKIEHPFLALPTTVKDRAFEFKAFCIDKSVGVISQLPAIEIRFDQLDLAVLPFRLFADQPPTDIADPVGGSASVLGGSSGALSMSSIRKRGAAASLLSKKRNTDRYGPINRLARSLHT